MANNDHPDTIEGLIAVFEIKSGSSFEHTWLNYAESKWFIDVVMDVLVERTKNGRLTTEEDRLELKSNVNMAIMNRCLMDLGVSNLST